MQECRIWLLQDNGKDDLNNALLAFFLGVGMPLLEEALEVLSNREIELASEEEKDKVVHEADELCDIDWDPLDGLDAEHRASALVELTKHMDACFDLQKRITEMASRKKNNKKALTPTQLAAITKAGDSLKSYQTERARTYVLRSTCRGLSLCASALEHDGYLNTASGETTGSGKAAAESNTASGETGSAQAAAESCSGALAKEHLEEALMPAHLYGHKLWVNHRTHFVDWGCTGTLRYPNNVCVAEQNESMDGL